MVVVGIMLNLLLLILFAKYGVYADYRDRPTVRLDVISVAHYLYRRICTLNNLASAITDRGPQMRTSWAQVI
ncbi:uncharacterized protein GGS25DRAFT_500332 [Hypoxylon fragiforme]|uniref:uncharacterized protein n=1 Tax=Hypoxylon fragiforme TaxID=63214 RepID=UPI0020C6AC54|nr:uncharacterized protein GGS25DRAFT_500332 [Hypoxylon fragiforme]KAI2606260.1 hypothetical protein GGS25DRAFT_500332 [Hypoxylon fragiforme]